MEHCVFPIESFNIYSLYGSVIGESATGILLLNNTYLVNMSDTVRAQGDSTDIVEASTNSTIISHDGGSIVGGLFRTSFGIENYRLKGLTAYGVFISDVELYNVTMSDLDVTVVDLLGEGVEGAGDAWGIWMSFPQVCE